MELFRRKRAGEDDSEKLSKMKRILIRFCAVAVIAGFAMVYYMFSKNDNNGPLSVGRNAESVNTKSVQDLEKANDEIKKKAFSPLAQQTDGGDVALHVEPVRPLDSMPFLMAMPEQERRELLVAGLSDPDPAKRRSSVSAIGLLGDRELLPRVREALNDSSPSVYRSALISLGSLESSTEAQRQAITTADEDTQIAAVSSLANICSLESFAVICDSFSQLSGNVQKIALQQLLMMLTRNPSLKTSPAVASNKLVADGLSEISAGMSEDVRKLVAELVAQRSNQP